MNACQHCARPGSRRGLTLIELLAALTILSVFTAAATAWMTTSARAQAAIEQTLSARVTAQRIADLIRDDLLSSIPATVSPDLASGRLAIITADILTQDSPGWRRVRWFLDPNTNELIRTTQPTDSARPSRRIIAWGVSRFSLERVARANTAATNSNWTGLRISITVENASASVFWERPQ